LRDIFEGKYTFVSAASVGIHHLAHSFAGSIILRITYGIKTQEDHDYYVSLVERAVEGIIHTGNFGDFLVDYLPLLKRVPCMSAKLFIYLSANYPLY